MAHADEATLDWRTERPGQIPTFQRGSRGNMFAAEENLTPVAEADVDADAAAHPFVTWRTKEFMWSLHCKDPGTFSQTHGSILTVISHMNDVPCCWTQTRGTRAQSARSLE